MDDSRFPKFVNESWGELRLQGRGIFVLKEKLKLLKEKLKVWNKEIFGDLNLKRKDLIARLNELDKQVEDGGPNDENSKQRKEVSAELWSVARFHESLLRQKFRTKWIKEGDANTKFFHRCINWRRRLNNLDGVLLDGRWEEEPALVKKGVQEFFAAKFKASYLLPLRPDNVLFQSVSEADNLYISAPFDVVEIKGVVWECSGEKSPGSGRVQL